MHCMLRCAAVYGFVTTSFHSDTVKRIARLSLDVPAVLVALCRVWMRQGDVQDLLHWFLQCHLPRLRSRLWHSQVGAT